MVQKLDLALRVKMSLFLRYGKGSIEGTIKR